MLIDAIEVNQHLAALIVAVFREDQCGSIHRELSEFTVEDWQQSYRWLDGSGLEIYLLDRLKTLGAEGAIPTKTRLRMERNCADNRSRMDAMFEEFMRIDQTMQRAELDYCNVKGFALAPWFCPAPELRRQMSIDFIVERASSAECAELLRQRGYFPHGIGEHLWEYRADTGKSQPGIGLYESHSDRSIRIYLVSADTAGAERAPYNMLLRQQLHTWRGYTFPVPRPSEHFIALAIRMLGHFEIEWNRLAFLLEFKRFLDLYRHDDAFWSDVLELARKYPIRSIAVGTVTLAATQIFGGVPPQQLQAWTDDKIDGHIRRWSETHGWETLVAKSPGMSLHGMRNDLPNEAL
jgi:Uncharacterised nucleotidyltransferase